MWITSPRSGLLIELGSSTKELDLIIKSSTRFRRMITQEGGGAGSGFRMTQIIQAIKLR